jgi:hypothetical protein
MVCSKFQRKDARASGCVNFDLGLFCLPLDINHECRTCMNLHIDTHKQEDHY